MSNGRFKRLRLRAAPNTCIAYRGTYPEHLYRAPVP
jgi:hypothetical protein